MSENHQKEHNLKLPNGWTILKLHEIVQPRGDKVLPQDFPNMPFLGMKNVEAHTSRIIDTEPAKKFSSSASYFYAGDVLYGRLRPYLNKVVRPEFDGLASGEFIVFSENDLIDANFLKFRLSSGDFVSFASHLNEGDRPRVNFKQIGDFELLLPPTNEQRRIIAKIEELFSELEAGVEALEQARAQLKRYRQSLLKAAFEGRLTEDWRGAHADELEPAPALLARIRAEREARAQAQLAVWARAVAEWEAAGKPGRKPSKPRKPKELPPLTEKELAALPALPEGWGGLPALRVGWGWVRLGQLNTEISDGPFGSNLKTSDYVDAGVRVIRLENIGRLKFDNSKKSYISEEKYEVIKKHTVHGGDIIFSSFIADELRVVVLPPSIDKAINKADCFLVRVLNSTMSNGYLAMYLSTRQVYNQLKHQIHGATRPRINTTQLKHSIIPVCSPAEQNVIVETLEAQFFTIDYLDQTIDQALKQATALRQAILKKAFSGRLVAQDPEDEPAGVLLERIRGEKEKDIATNKKNLGRRRT